uniref:NADH-ubiquinone oxidoreductase chain 4L n=1 Tax=Paroedura masobe TaxID=347812 RepID=A0A7R7G1R2_9SAUR|nr:NADH dehydrogenase subunit 4L [Paroedura masobe]
MSQTHFATTTLFALGVTGLTLHRKHLVSALLCIEGLMLATFIALTVSHQELHSTAAAMHPIILLTLAACEAGAGLSLLVATTRAYASDNIKNLSLLKC